MGHGQNKILFDVHELDESFTQLRVNQYEIPLDDSTGKYLDLEGVVIVIEDDPFASISMIRSLIHTEMIIQDDKMVFYVQTDDGHAFVIGFEGVSIASESVTASYIKHMDGNFHDESIFENSDARMVIFNRPLTSSEWP